LIVWVNYRSKKIFIRFILSHAEYDRERWKHDCDCD
jgi:mRNA-degrading endonuclease HigB of HigAB toxin-antitoxin module